LLHQEATKAKTNKKEKTAGLLPSSDSSGEKEKKGRIVS